MEEPYSYSNFTAHQESPSIVNLTGPDTSHVMQEKLFRTSTFVESIKETNKIETKQQKSKATEYKILEDKFQMLEYTIFQDGGSNSLSPIKSELVVSYSNFPCEQLNFAAKPTIFAAIQSPSFPSVSIAADTAYARKITVHLCRRQQ
jgi:hypothetical protein